MEYRVKPFSALLPEELFQIYYLRSEVFIVEQNCVYQDVDHKDPAALHVMWFEGAELLAYARILPPGLSYKEASIGRVAVKQQFRGKGTGRKLMKYCIQQTLELFKNQGIVISAQAYLERFYTELGFTAEGNHYLLDNILHIDMRFKRI